MTTKGDELTWQWYWGWFNSDVLSDKERTASAKWFIDADILGGLGDDAVYECLEFAPKVFIQYLFETHKIKRTVCSKLLGVKETRVIDKPPSCEEVMEMIRIAREKARIKYGKPLQGK